MRLEQDNMINQICNVCPQLLKHPKCSSFPWGTRPCHLHRSQQPHQNHRGRLSPFPSTGSMSLSTSMSTESCSEGIPTYFEKQSISRAQQEAIRYKANVKSEAM